MNISASELFLALSHETRLRCLVLLGACDERCVCELTQVIDAAQPHVSRHLAHLRDLGLVQGRRDGLWIHYRLNPTLPRWVKNILVEAFNGVSGQQPFCDDLRQLAQQSGADMCSRRSA